MQLTHICGETLEGNVFQSHGTTVFDPSECPSCGQPLIESEMRDKTDNTLMDNRQAMLTIAAYCCSNCWGDLNSHPTGDGRTHVLCYRCGDQTRGYVSKRYVNRRRQDSLADKLNARYILRYAINSPASGQTEQQILKSLGY